MTRQRSAALAGCAGLWIALTAALLSTGGAVQRLDAAVRSAVLSQPSDPLLDLAVRACVLVGQRGLWLPLLGLVAVTSSRRHRRLRPLAVTVGALAVLTALVAVAKQVIARTAPAAGTDTVLAGGASYPSGHAAGATVAYVLLALLLTAEGGWLGPGRRTPALVCAAGLSALTGIGVVLRDYHWTSDSVAGWLLGAVVVLAASTMLADDQPVPAAEQGLR